MNALVGYIFSSSGNELSRCEKSHPKSHLTALLWVKALFITVTKNAKALVHQAVPGVGVEPTCYC